MKNKKTLYILVPSVVLIWGFIVWKVLDLNKPETISYSPDRFHKASEEMDSTRYQPKMSYGDPFLRRSRQGQVSTSTTPVKKENKLQKINMTSMTGPARPENLVYHGVIACNEDRIGLLEFGNQKRLIKEEGMIGEYRIVSMEEDSLRISFHDKEFTYGKQ